MFFLSSGWKSRKSRDTWSNRRVGLWSKNEAGQRRTEFCQENTLVIVNTLFQQLKRWLLSSSWTSPDGQYQNQFDYILCSWRWRSTIESAKTRLGADCGSDHELLTAKFRLKLKKVGKTIRPFRFDLNQIPYDYTVELTNRFKGLHLIDSVPEEVWRRFITLTRRPWSKPPPRKRNAKRQNSCLSRLTNSCEKKISKRQRRKGKIFPFECRVPKKSKKR